MVEKDKKTFWQLIIGILITCFVALVIGLFFVTDKSAFLWGVLLGALVSIFLLKHMAYTIGKALSKPSKIAERYTIKNYVLRYFINLATLVGAVLWDEISIIGVFIGLFSIKIAAFIFPYINKVIFKNR